MAAAARQSLQQCLYLGLGGGSTSYALHVGNVPATKEKRAVDRTAVIAAAAAAVIAAAAAIAIAAAITASTDVNAVAVIATAAAWGNAVVEIATTDGAAVCCPAAAGAITRAGQDGTRVCHWGSRR